MHKFARLEGHLLGKVKIGETFFKCTTLRAPKQNDWPTPPRAIHLSKRIFLIRTCSKGDTFGGGPVKIGPLYLRDVPILFTMHNS